MGRQKGTPKTGGRVKGTPNKRPAIITILEQTLHDYFEKPQDGATAFQRDLASVDSDQRLHAVEKYMTYLYPKKQAVQADLTIDADLTIEDTINDMI